MVELALAYPERGISVKRVATRQRLSIKYLEQIMSRLKKADLVESVRGIHGGYRLTKAPESVTLREIYLALEGTPVLVQCIVNPRICALRSRCPTRQVWKEMGQAMERVLDGLTLRDIMQKGRGEAPCPAPSYQI
jgi:Rrf2 family protein